MTPASENTTIPPTLLRLPDLDPEATLMMQTVAPTVQEGATSMPPPPPTQPAAAKPQAGLAKGSSTSISRSVESSLFKSPVMSSVVTHDPSVEPGELLSSYEADDHDLADDESRVTQTTASSDDSESWLAAFASRKTLLVLLAIIAGAAIFFPRGESATSEQDTPLLVDESQPEPTVIPFQIEKYPANRLASPVASVAAPVVTPQPPARPVEKQIATVVQKPSTLVPQPPKTPWDEQPADAQPSDYQNREDQFESFANSAGQLDDALSFARLHQPSPSQQTFPVQSPTTDLSSSGNAVDTMDSASGFDETAEAPARLFNSRTPFGIYNWTKFLPPVDADSFAVSAASPSSNQNANTSPAVPDIRTSTSPVAPSFEFALPGGTTANMPSSASSSDSVQSNSTGSPVLGPEARVAMPPQPSLR